MSELDRVSARHEDEWQRNANAWKWERAAQVALLLAIASALGALFSWCMFLQGNDVRRNPLFWAMAVPLMVWIGALQSTKRWAVRSLGAALVLWPALSLAALVLARQQRALSERGNLDLVFTREAAGLLTRLCLSRVVEDDRKIWIDRPDKAENRLHSRVARLGGSVDVHARRWSFLFAASG